MEFYAIVAGDLHRYFKGLVLTFSDIMERYWKLEEIDNGNVISEIDFVGQKNELLNIIEKCYPEYIDCPLFVDMRLYYSYKGLPVFIERISDSDESSFELENDCDDNDEVSSNSSNCFDTTDDGMLFLGDI